jgi:RNA recognition motif-containing protein
MNYGSTALGSEKLNERNPAATLWVAGLDEQATEEIVWELMLQCGPIGKCCSARSFLLCVSRKSMHSSLHIMYTHNTHIHSLTYMDNSHAHVQKNNNAHIHTHARKHHKNTVSVSIPRDKITNAHQGFAFVEFENVDDSDYAMRST